MLTLTRKREPTRVEERHLEYFTPLTKRLDSGRRRVAAQEAYVRSAVTLGVKVAPLSRAADAATTNSKALAVADRNLERIRRALAAGCEPTTPPEKWYCGMLEQPRKVKVWDEQRFESFKGYPRETWPTVVDRYSSRRPAVMVYQGAMPVEVLSRYAATKSLFDATRVYSPEKSDFEELRNPEPRDPVLIGRIDFLDRPQYFEIARWDIDRDLARVFGKIT